MSWNLPPGCTDADIDRAFGGPEPIECPDCGTLNDADEEECRNCGFRFVEPANDIDDSNPVNGFGTREKYP